MTEIQAGDLVTLRVTVAPEDGTPADGSTTATVAVTGPSGQVIAPTARPDGSPSQWVAAVVVDEPGEWHVLWTVRGQGEGVQPFTLPVAPAAAYDFGGRLYATTADYARWLRSAPPAGAGPALAEGSRALEATLIGARYDIDAAGYPTDPRIRRAFRDAVCAQVAYWDEIGDPAGTGAAEQWTTIGVGPVQLSRAGRGKGSGADLSPDIDAPAALRILRVEARLFPIRPWVYG
ncbi:MAG: hypothetical protein L0H64_16595 [Pseudonocardia sp.]|nr:hypothetical protein [Pseudonocardia sp.]